MSTVFVSYRLVIPTAGVDLEPQEMADLFLYGSTIIVLDGDLATMCHQHNEDYIFTTVCVESEVDKGVFAELVYQYLHLPGEVTGEVLIEQLIE